MTERLRILQVMRAPVGGLFRHVADLTRGLVARGHEVGLVMEKADAGPRWEKVIAELSGIAPLGLTRVPMARKIALSDVSAVRHIANRIRTEGIQVVHGHGAKGGAYARLATRFAGRPGIARIYTPHGGSLHFSPTSLEGRLYHGLERFLARETDAVVFESDFAKRGFAARLGLSDPRWPVIHNGLLPHEFEPVELAPDAVDIVYIGEMRDLKGVDLLIEALRDIEGRTALLVGSGPQREDYRARVEALGMADRIVFADPMPAREAFARGRIVVVPSRAESLPYLVLEAAAAGKPLVATKVGGIPEIVPPEAIEYLVPGGDADLLRAGLRVAIANPNEIGRHAAETRAHVLRRFDVERMIDAIEDTYRSNMNRRGNGSA